MERLVTLLVEVGLFLSGCTGAEWSDSVVGGVFRIHRLERKANNSVGGSEVDPHVCGLGSPGQVEIRFRIVRLSRHEIA